MQKKMEKSRSDHEALMALDRTRLLKDKWQPLGNGKFSCPTCRTELAVDTWVGTPYWRYCPICGKAKEVNLI